MSKWNSLSKNERQRLIKEYAKGGYLDMASIKKAYESGNYPNSYAKGGSFKYEPIFEVIPESIAAKGIERELQKYKDNLESNSNSYLDYLARRKEEQRRLSDATINSILSSYNRTENTKDIKGKPNPQVIIEPWGEVGKEPNKEAEVIVGHPVNATDDADEDYNRGMKKTYDYYNTHAEGGNLFKCGGKAHKYDGKSEESQFIDTPVVTNRTYMPELIVTPQGAGVNPADVHPNYPMSREVDYGYNADENQALYDLDRQAQLEREAKAQSLEEGRKDQQRFLKGVSYMVGAPMLATNPATGMLMDTNAARTAVGTIGDGLNYVGNKTAALLANPYVNAGLSSMAGAQAISDVANGNYRDAARDAAFAFLPWSKYGQWANAYLAADGSDRIRTEGLNWENGLQTGLSVLPAVFNAKQGVKSLYDDIKAITGKAVSGYNEARNAINKAYRKGKLKYDKWVNLSERLEQLRKDGQAWENSREAMIKANNKAALQTISKQETPYDILMAPENPRQRTVVIKKPNVTAADYDQVQPSYTNPFNGETVYPTLTTADGTVLEDIAEESFVFPKQSENPVVYDNTIEIVPTSKKFLLNSDYDQVTRNSVMVANPNQSYDIEGLVSTTMEKRLPVANSQEIEKAATVLADKIKKIESSTSRMKNRANMKTDPALQKAASDYVSSAEQIVGDKAVVTGSTLLTAQGVPKTPGDIEMITLESDIPEVLNRWKGTVSSDGRVRSGIRVIKGKSPYNAGYEGTFDIQVLETDANGNVKGKLAHQIYSQLFPEEYRKLVGEDTWNYINKGVFDSAKDFWETSLPISGKDMMKAYRDNALDIQIANTISSTKQKHSVALDYLLTNSELAPRVLKAIRMKGKSLVDGYQNVREAYPLLDLGNIEANKSFLRQLGFDEKYATNRDIMEALVEKVHYDALHTRAIKLEDIYKPTKDVKEIAASVKKRMYNNTNAQHGSGEGANATFGFGGGNQYGQIVGVFQRNHRAAKIKNAADLIKLERIRDGKPGWNLPLDPEEQKGCANLLKDLENKYRAEGDNARADICKTTTLKNENDIEKFITKMYKTTNRPSTNADFEAIRLKGELTQKLSDASGIRVTRGGNGGMGWDTYWGNVGWNDMNSGPYAGIYDVKSDAMGWHTQQDGSVKVAANSVAELGSNLIDGAPLRIGEVTGPNIAVKNGLSSDFYTSTLMGVKDPQYKEALDRIVKDAIKHNPDIIKDAKIYIKNLAERGYSSTDLGLPPNFSDEDAVNMYITSLYGGNVKVGLETIQREFPAAARHYKKAFEEYEKIHKKVDKMMKTPKRDHLGRTILKSKYNVRDIEEKGNKSLRKRQNIKEKGLPAAAMTASTAAGFGLLYGINRATDIRFANKVLNDTTGEYSEEDREYAHKILQKYEKEKTNTKAYGGQLFNYYK